MPVSPLAVTLLLASSFLGCVVSAQSSSGSMTWTVREGSAIPADWTLSMEARMKRQLAERRQQLGGAIRTAARGCPIDFRAEREGSLGLRATKSPNQNPGPGLDLSFGVGQRRVIEAEITVFGWSRELRMIPAAYPPETSERFVLSSRNDMPLAQELIWMKSLGVVNSVELTHVVFSDGTTWSQTGDLHCRVAPSKLVLVGASGQLK